MKPTKLFFIMIGVIVLMFAGNVLISKFSSQGTTEPVDSIPTTVTLSGTYVCLPNLDKTRTVPEECVFGLLTDDGVYYMVNFGASASAKEQFDKRAHITAKGFVVLKETLNTDHWAPYNMKGIFTITEGL